MLKIFTIDNEAKNKQFVVIPKILEFFETSWKLRKMKKIITMESWLLEPSRETEIELEKSRVKLQGSTIQEELLLNQVIVSFEKLRLREIWIPRFTKYLLWGYFFLKQLVCFSPKSELSRRGDYTFVLLSALFTRQVATICHQHMFFRFDFVSTR